MNKRKVGILISFAVFGLVLFSVPVLAKETSGNHLTKSEKDFLDETGITKFQKNRIEKYCKTLNMDPDEYIEQNYSDILYGNAFYELERQYIEHYVGDMTQELPAEGILTDAGYTIHTCYQVNVSFDENGNEIEEFVPDFFVTRTEEEDPLPESVEIDHTDYSLYPPFEYSSDGVLRVYDESSMDIAIEVAKASAQDGTFKVDVFKQGEGYQKSVYYKDNELFMEGRGDDPNKYGYRNADGEEMSEAEIMDAFLELYPEPPCKVRAAKSDYARSIYVNQLAGGVPREEAYQKYQDTLMNIDQHSLGDLYALSVETNELAQQNKVKIEPVYGEYKESFINEVNRKEPNFVELEDSFETEFKSALLECVNNLREENGLDPLEEGSLVLGDFANTRSIEASYLMNPSHDRPESSVPFSVPCAENLSLVTGVDLEPEELAKTVFDGWLNSPPHKENMLNPDHKSMELGITKVIRNGSPAYYTAQNFMDIEPDEIDDLYKDADTSVVKPKVMIAELPEAVNGPMEDLEPSEKKETKTANKDFTKNYYSQAIVGDVPTVSGHTPTTLFTDRHDLGDGNVVWSAHIGDQNGTRLGDLMLMDNTVPPDYLNYTYVYLTSFSYMSFADYWSYDVAGTNDRSIHGNLEVYATSPGNAGIDEYGNPTIEGENFVAGDAY